MLKLQSLWGMVRGEEARRGRKSGQPVRTQRHRPLILESLEDRTLLTTYTVTDLGTLGGRTSYANGINDVGQVVGESLPVAARLPHAFLYSDGSMTDLGVLALKSSTAEAINNAGYIVGSTNYPGGGPQQFHAFGYASGVMSDLGTLGGTNSYAVSVNNSGQVAGYSNYTGGPDDKFHAFLYSNGSMTDLGTLPGNNDSRALGNNDAGDVVGVSTDGTSPRAFLYSGGSLTNLGVLPGFSVGSEARAINSSGLIVGGSYGEFGVNKQKIYHGFLYSNGVLTDLGNLGQGGNWSFAYAINDAGLIVGEANTTFGDSPKHAFLYEGGQMKDLNTLLSNGTGWVLTAANDINNNGQIVGYGTINNKLHAFLLTPDAAPDAPGETNLDPLTAQNMPTEQGGGSGLVENPLDSAGQFVAMPPVSLDVSTGSATLTTTGSGSTGSAAEARAVHVANLGLQSELGWTILEQDPLA